MPLTQSDIDRMALAVMEWPGQERCIAFQFRPLREEALSVVIAVGPCLTVVTFDRPECHACIWHRLDRAEQAARSVLPAVPGAFPAMAHGLPSMN